MEIVAEGLSQLCADPHAALLRPRLDEIIFRLDKYMDEIEYFNPAYGLVKISGRKELAVKHILDSITPLGCMISLFAPADPASLRLADAGSGAGLPGIPLAVCLPDTEITLVERAAKRAGFLRNTAAVLGLSNITIEETEFEKAAPGRFDLVVFRALSPLAGKALKKLARLVRTADSPGNPHSRGILAAYKGKRAKTEQELAACPGVQGEIIPLQVPFLDEERCLVVIR